jgi:hypothetical protein
MRTAGRKDIGKKKKGRKNRTIMKRPMMVRQLGTIQRGTRKRPTMKIDDDDIQSTPIPPWDNVRQSCRLPCEEKARIRANEWRKWQHRETRKKRIRKRRKRRRQHSGGVYRDIIRRFEILSCEACHIFQCPPKSKAASIKRRIPRKLIKLCTTGPLSEENLDHNIFSTFASRCAP